MRGRGLGRALLAAASTALVVSIPTAEPANATLVIGMQAGLTIASGNAHTVALRPDGSVWAWGRNTTETSPPMPGGQVGDGSAYEYRHAPVPVVGMTDAVAVAAGHYHSLAVKSDGSVWAWGRNGTDTSNPSGLCGQLGDGSTSMYSAVPVRVRDIDNAVAVAAGRCNSYALTADGSVWAWGSNVAGKLGIGQTPGMSRVPVRISGLSGVTAIGAGHGQAFAVREDGSVWGWGSNYRGGLGTGVDCDACPSYVPVQVVDITDAVAVAAAQNSGGHALDSTGRVWSWGDNDLGDLGFGSYIRYSTRPGVGPGLSGVSTLGAGGRVVVS